MERHIVVPLDDFGQPGKSVTLENPAAKFSWQRLKQIRKELKDDEQEGGLRLLGQIVVSYDALDIDGAPLPPLSEKADALEDLAIGILLHLIAVAYAAMETAVPKELRTRSATT